MRIKYLCILLLMTPISACHKITLSAIEAPITHHADWQAIQSTEYHRHFSTHVGDIYVLKASQTATDLPLWFNQQVHAYYTKVLNQSTLQQLKFSGKNVHSMYAVAKKDDLAWRRVEMYALADYVIWVNIDNNIDSISYEAMQSFISDLVFRL